METTPLLPSTYRRRLDSLPYSSRLAKAGQASSLSHAVGPAAPYKEYATINWLRDLVKDNERHRLKSAGTGTSARGVLAATLLGRLASRWDSAQAWIAAIIIGVLTAGVAFIVDVSVVTVADWKEGYCLSNIWLNRRSCCSLDTACQAWRPWTSSFPFAYPIYVIFALVFGVIAAAITTTTKTELPSLASIDGHVTRQDDGTDDDGGDEEEADQSNASRPKIMYMAAGSGIPEIKTILSGFAIPDFLSFKVLVVKAVGATFAVATGMCLGKEGPFIHISTCVGYLVARAMSKYDQNESKMREMLSVACCSGLSVAFGSPIGGVLFSYEEISTYFPRRVLWKSFLCSLVAAATLRELNPTGTGKLVLFETNYGVEYDVVHYLVFILLGVCDGVFGGVFCNANFFWSRHFRDIYLIKKSPVLEVFLVVLVTACLQYPNPLIRDTGDIMMERLLVDCNDVREDWICQQEARLGGKGTYYAWLISGTLVKLVLTTITFGCKVPSGIIIPALDAGALFGRMIGQAVPDISPGIFAMVGSAAFLAGVSRMTVSLAVIMFELTGEVNFIPPFMVAILTAKCVADVISAEGVYDLAQHTMGHPFLDAEQAVVKLRAVRNPDSCGPPTIRQLSPPASVMEKVMVRLEPNNKLPICSFRETLTELEARHLADLGLVMVNEQGVCQAHLAEDNFRSALCVLEESERGGLSALSLCNDQLGQLIDPSPLCVSADAPIEYAAEMLGKLGLSHLIMVDHETARAVGVVGKKRLLEFLHVLK
ncbi:hypothetical protein E4U43_008214 [Claviceps pusilla]|uniref:Chloride channel protein n=1 Tax=Claviceps pusilla TaxID=123648 RepID=A0A9P7SXG8_9HYPO|nr:hypothetical protein E4U43_008214 [Claviceps pusilla]